MVRRLKTPKKTLLDPGNDEAMLAALRAVPTEGLGSDLRRRLVAMWGRDAQAEHASVGSFARFSLQLLAVAAPPDLLDLSQVAARDEIAHARFTFALASRLAGETLGPGPLPLDGDVLGPLDLPSVLASTVIEGAIGETLAALRAREASRLAKVPAIAALLGRIAEDETRHAELAWRTLRWGMEGGAEDAVFAVTEAFAQGLREPPPEENDPDDAGLAAYGQLSPARVREVHLRGMAQVLQPAQAALLDAVVG